MLKRRIHSGKLTFDPLARYLNQRSARYERRALLRPMSANEMSDAALRAYRALGGPSLKLTAVPALFATAALYFLISFVLPMFGRTSDAKNINVQVAEAIIVLALAVCVALPLIIFSMSFASALISSMVADFMVGNLPNPQESQSTAIKNLGKIFKFGLREAVFGSGGVLIGALFLMASALAGQGNVSDDTAAFVTGLGILAISLGFIWMPLVYAFECLAVPAILVEGLGVRDAAKRSRVLMKAVGRQPGGLQYVFNAYGMIFLLLFFLGMGLSASLGLSALFESGAGMMELAGRNEVIAQILSILPVFLAVWFLVPVWATMTTILYFERRVRLEGYDIETLGRDVGRTHKSNRFEL